ncbi:NeuD/PglB/VioB family sugar acetyltransferase [Frankia sp. CNm7]|uniref:NeuD/PglB/VioB family sugar acetyltransferase n=1 Tax=Frankia nepalensis TaxID=1836974 RepID=A0A937RCG4_9ACTN|nr:NeuD/PglB/VioB family sugar acetyltransferase [Frankia nepalensis]MBL7501911.1 NeuD/PglB/VioB family sugar acetyltransferase [Frankia nepalensis]MBL7513916.1 NeuD/PglB/VioB family sugar acetyltransferase [Frankia nepalensis]MBL7521321.1 NeuD/PglB/VioB family sugar acetyltransferase [Frankia nepalensis]MBL7629568.1 NeuD/PglB/VioB family sugar acetyltransferase [Frankia nepalensis]
MTAAGPVPLLIVGAGGLAREAAEAARASGDHHVVGFLDDNPALWGAPIGGAQVLGGLERVAHYPRARLLLGPGRGRSRAVLRQRLDEVGVSADRYTSVVHPRAVVPPSCSVGPGSILLAGVVLTADVTVGQHVAVMPNAVLTHDVVVEDYVSVCASASLAGAVRVRTGAYLGQNCTVREGLTVGAWSLIGMGAAVITAVGDCQIWAGVPAQFVRPVAEPPPIAPTGPSAPPPRTTFARVPR